MNDIVYVMKRYITDLQAEEVLIKDDNISLLSVNQSEAVFSRSSKGVNIFDPNISSFFFHAQYRYAEDLIMVPLKKFENIAKEKLKILSFNTSEVRLKRMIVIFSHPRSGSSFFAQCFSDYPGTKIMNEPSIFVELFRSKNLSLLKYVLFYLGKELLYSKETNLVIKLPPIIPGLWKHLVDISEEMPFTMYFLFLHRKPIPSFKSWLKLVTVYSYDELRYLSKLPIIGRFFPDLVLKHHHHFVYPIMVSQLKSVVNDENSWNEKYLWMEDKSFAFDYVDVITTALNRKEEKVAKLSFHSHFSAYWLIPMLIIHELKSNKKYSTKILPVFYEALTEDTRIWFNTVLPFCKIKPFKGNLRLLESSKDSQEKSRFSRKELSQSIVQITSGEIEKMSFLLSKCKLATDVYLYNFDSWISQG